jgi:hypothetical protein
MKLKEYKRTRRGRRQDHTGRSIGPPRFLKVEHWIFKTEAWRSLSAQARAVYIEIAQRFNGSNNGEISLSVREAARLVNIAKDTASRAFHELENKGFIRRNTCGSFNWKLKQATTWILTEHSFMDKAATKEFARWSPKNSEPDPNSGTRCPKPGTMMERSLSNRQLSVLLLGPWFRFCTVDRSQTAARI